MLGLKYIGADPRTDFLPGVPARDLTADEAERWPQAAGSALYAAAGGSTPAGAEFLPADAGDDEHDATEED